MYQSEEHFNIALGDAKTNPNNRKKVVIHPIVLLSIVDHYNRVAKGTSKRVVGTLLGELHNTDEIHVTNSYALPFEEDSRDPMVWYIDHNYHEQMYLMFKKINTKEKIIGWYSTGPKTKVVDIDIHELFRRYCADPLYLIADVTANDFEYLSNPISAYFSMDDPNSILRKKFVHNPCTIGAFEAEEVGVEHLLRDLKNTSTSSLVSQISDTINSCKILISKLQESKIYFNDIIEGKIPPNHGIVSIFQDIFNLLPDSSEPEIISAFSNRYADMILTIYGMSCLRSVLSMHDLVNNVSENRTAFELSMRNCNSDF
ncbi:26s proteasome regulatory inactive JAB domain-containing protein [Cryptosporidium ubiquitum]|uniref:26s proteasome regulatory inactive JAB domain-containing protein n=1 Tax=Cryptosporidium ubiquitum TaxID=857276 RepID=A0A1J4MKW5_9CRYT|nr:26s proteasome regulatory inactive JAB domain-containing protein [Cryptosporidium ubiquitum]OII74830.1 26s proteasome regulatory inactive JAB domain-containing protein [Cryptosporidium ubiquitum]